VDFVPVALAYEHFGRLQYLRVERNWQLWHQRLEALRTEVVPPKNAIRAFLGASFRRGALVSLGHE